MPHGVNKPSPSSLAGLDDCHLVQLPSVPDERGNLTFMEGGRHIPFAIARVFYLYAVPGDAMRGAHAHKTLEQFIICVSGAFTVILDDGHERRTIKLDRADCGLYIPPLIWDEEIEFSPGGICLVLASQPYKESDYLRNYDQFRAAREQYQQVQP